MINIDQIIENIKKLILPKPNEVKQLYDLAKDIFLKEENIINIKTPIIVCGDIHGQFSDLLELFCVGGDVPDMKYIFMGDYVDRGRNSVETFLLFLALKIRYPQRIILLRGNHESRQITQVYGFYDECNKKYGNTDFWKLCTEIFDLLPLAAIVDNTVFCVHGGLSPKAVNIDSIKALDRKIEVPPEGIMSDLLWSDPDPEALGFTVSARGAGFTFGEQETKKFNQINGFQLVARAHQLVMEGYSIIFYGMLVTVWSAPNYCYRCGNIASVMEFDEHLNRSFKLFEAAPIKDNKKENKSNIMEYFL